MTSPIARIAEANAAALTGDRVLTIGFGPDVVEIVGAAVAFASDLPTARALGIDPSAWFTAPASFDLAVIALPKERERLAMTLAMARAVIAEGGRIAVIGHNKAGIRGAERLMNEMIGEPRALDARAHHRLLVARGSPQPAALADWRLETEQLGLRIVSYPGVFSHRELDPGTSLLIDHLPTNARRVLDAGCGSGIVGARLGARGASVTATDLDAVAVVAAGETLSANGVDGTAVVADLFDDGPFELIASNPPFHRGIRTTTAVAGRLIAESSDHLVPGGELWIVANRHLGLARLVTAAFGDCQIVEDDGRFQVLRAKQGNQTSA